MIPFAAMALSAAIAQIEAIGLTEVEGQPALRVSFSGRPAEVRVEREPPLLLRLSLSATRLGPHLAGMRRWTPRDSGAAPPAADSPLPPALEIDAQAGQVSLLLRIPAGSSVDVQREEDGLLLVFRRAPPTRPAPPGAAPSGAPPGEMQEVIRRLFPTAAAAEAARGADAVPSVAALYPRLFPAGAPEAKEPAAPGAEAKAPEQDVLLGPFRLRASTEARYVAADTFLESAQPTRDEFLELDPRVLVEAPLGAGRLTTSYKPALRALASHPQINSSSHAFSGDLELPLGEGLVIRADDRFVIGTLDTRVVDPGGEYFFGLGRFHRNDLEAGASFLLGPRLSLELAGGMGSVHFLQQSSFFDYDTRAASAGLGFELTPNLKAVAAYVFDSVPRPPERPEAGSQAHSARLALSGEVLPLVNGELSVGYRRQTNPDAAPDGRRYAGLTVAGTLTRQISHESSLALYLARMTPVSAFENNGFYVSTSLQSTLQLPLPFALQLRGGLGVQWNQYRTQAQGIAGPREDRILGWFAALRRPIRGRLFLSGSYHAERRHSNLERFVTDSSGFVLQIEWDMLGGPVR